MDDKIYKQLKKKLNDVDKNISLSKYTTFKIGGPAKYLYEAKDASEVYTSILIAKKLKIKTFILGGGSNVLVGDKGFNGLVIKINARKYSFNGKILIADAGVNLGILIREAEKRELGGLWFIAGIPGTLGGAIRGNAGAFGKGIGDLIEEVEAVDFSNRSVRKITLKNKDLKFKYRDSIAKHKDIIVLRAKLKLIPTGKCKNYQNIDKIIIEREKKQPLKYPNAGCIFKNIPYNNSLQKLKKYAVHGKIPAAALIDEAGLKGMQIGSAQISRKHANFIVNIGSAKAADVLKLIQRTKNIIMNKYKICLEEEIKILEP